MVKEEKVKMAQYFVSHVCGFYCDCNTLGYEKKKIGDYTNFWITGQKRETFFSIHQMPKGYNVIEFDGIQIGYVSKQESKIY